MILIDLQEAFDTLDHKILLKKMTCPGFKTSVIKWIESYLSTRKFFASMNDTFSEAGILNCGIPQVFIIGPILFLIFINDLLQSSESGSYIYADDTCIFSQDKDIHKIEDVLIKQFSTLYEWFVDNKLSIQFRADKTRCILFSKTEHKIWAKISHVM